MAELRGVFWDVDGTLADTEMDGHRPAFNQAFEDLGLPLHWTREHYAELLSVPGGMARVSSRPASLASASMSRCFRHFGFASESDTWNAAGRVTCVGVRASCV